jgi:hypothetical protein
MAAFIAAASMAVGIGVLAWAGVQLPPAPPLVPLRSAPQQHRTTTTVLADITRIHRVIESVQKWRLPRLRRPHAVRTAQRKSKITRCAASATRYRSLHREATSDFAAIVPARSHAERKAAVCVSKALVNAFWRAHEGSLKNSDTIVGADLDLSPVGALDILDKNGGTSNARNGGGIAVKAACLNRKSVVRAKLLSPLQPARATPSRLILRQAISDSVASSERGERHEHEG